MGQNVIYNIIATGMTFYFQSVIFIPAIAIIPMLKYEITNAKHKEIMAELNKRRNAAG